MIIDMHAHIADKRLFPAYFIDGIKENILKTIEEQSDIPPNKRLIERLIKNIMNDQDCSNLLQQMDEAGIDKTVLLITDLDYGHEKSCMELEEMNQQFHDVYTKHPDRFVVFAGVDPRREDALVFLENSVKKYNFKGLKLYPPCGYRMNCKELLPIYRFCNNLGLPVLCHSGPSLESMYLDSDLASSIEEIAEAYPYVKFVLGHAAFEYFQENIDLAKKFKNVYLEVSGFQNLLGEPNVVEEQLKRLFSEVPDQVLFGTDWPMYSTFGNQKKWVDYFENCSILTTDEKEKLFYKNAAKVLGIQKERR